VGRDGQWRARTADRQGARLREDAKGRVIGVNRIDHAVYSTQGVWYYPAAKAQKGQLWMWFVVSIPKPTLWVGDPCQGKRRARWSTRPTSNRGHRDERITKIRKRWADSASGNALRLSRATFPDIRLPCRAVATPSGPFVAGWGIRGRDKEAFSRQLVELVSLPRCANGGEALGSKQTSTLETDGMTWFAMPGLGPGFQRLSWIKA
jgi:hypothetical protein